MNLFKSLKKNIDLDPEWMQGGLYWEWNANEPELKNSDE